MDVTRRIEQALGSALSGAESPAAPPGLANALRYAVFPGGARLRPRLCLAVAMACADDAPALSDASAASIELLHCASLVHDDLPCFDDAPTRRGKPSVHSAFGERLAVLAGDALIVAAFQVLGRAGAAAPHRLAALLGTVARGVGMPTGIVAGQAWECEPQVRLSDYQRAKTAALFEAAAVAGAVAAGAEPGPWRAVGERLGEAYQVADDISDVMANPAELGKPVGRDVLLGRPSAARELGLDGAVRRFEEILDGAVAAIPDCPGAGELRNLILAQAQRLLPKGLARRAA
jgi:geranylgeranyl diphosphate synthase type II